MYLDADNIEYTDMPVDGGKLRTGRAAWRLVFIQSIRGQRPSRLRDSGESGAVFSPSAPVHRERGKAFPVQRVSRVTMRVPYRPLHY